jgi:hypothetical protein
MGDISRHGIETPHIQVPQCVAKSVTHVAGLKCYLCLRIEPYDHLKRTGRADDVLALLRAALLPMHGGDGPGLKDPPAFTRSVPGQFESTFRQIDAAQTDSYATRSKLEALQTEFKVLAKSLLDALK